MHEESNVALHLPWYVVISAAIAVRSWRAEDVRGHISKIPCDEVFVEPRLPREVQRSPMSCSLCGAQLSENGAALAHMAVHLRTFLPHGDSGPVIICVCASSAVLIVIVSRAFSRAKWRSGSEPLHYKLGVQIDKPIGS